MAEEGISKENLRLLVDSELQLDAIHKLIRMPIKDADRFWKYLEVLQERVPWKDKILVRISDKLYVVKKKDGKRVVKCDCGQEFGDYRVNWKLSADVYVRRTDEEIAEVYTTQIRPREGYVEVREFYCPGCQAQLGVEVVPEGYPFIFEVFPDIDGLHKLEGKPLPDAREDWFEDRTPRQTELWVKEK